MQIELLENANPPGADDVTAGLRAHMIEKTGALPWIPLTLLLRGHDNRVYGGIRGNIALCWLQVDHFWVDEALRGQGYGSRLLDMAEEAAWMGSKASGMVHSASSLIFRNSRSTGQRRSGSAGSSPRARWVSWYTRELGTLSSMSSRSPSSSSAMAKCRRTSKLSGGNMFRACVLTALVAGMVSPAFAETPRDWYIEMKRSAKTVRIAAATGSRAALSEELLHLYRLTRRIDTWSPKPEKASVICETATHDLYKAAKAAEAGELKGPSGYEGHMSNYQRREEGCFQAILAQ